MRQSAPIVWLTRDSFLVRGDRHAPELFANWQLLSAHSPCESKQEFEEYGGRDSSLEERSHTFGVHDVIFVIIALGALLFVGSRAWQSGTDRARCILNIR